MDQRPNLMSQEMRDIAQTRTAMAEKLEQLEARVQHTVQDAKTTVLDIVDHVKDTAESMVDRAEEFVEHTKHTLDPTQQISRHPWIVFGGAIVVGYLLGTIEGRQSSGGPIQRRLPYDDSDAYSSDRSANAEQANLWDGIVREVQQEIVHTKGALIEVGRSFVHDFLRQILPSLLSPSQKRRSHESEYARTPYRDQEDRGSDFYQPRY